MSSNRYEDLPLVEGTITGAFAWLLGYVFTYLIVAPDIRDSPLNQFLEAFEGEPATYEMVGWVFYNAHFVDTVYRDLPLIGSRSASAIGGDGGFSAVLYLVPVGLLFAAGLALAGYRAAETPAGGVVAGATTLPAYLVLSLAGLVFFEVSIGGATGGPDFLTGAVVAGIVYPLVAAGVGGAAGALLGGDGSTR